MTLHARHFFKDAELKRIEEAVRQAEERTSGEIVPVLASRASGYARGLFYAAVATALSATLALFGFYCLPFEFLGHDPWEIPLYILLPVQALAFLGGYHLARAVPSFHRAFIPRAYLQRRAEADARRAFLAMRLKKTKAATGILLYVSLFERVALVLADPNIYKKLPAKTWDGVRDLLLQGLRQGQAADGYEKAIAECGRLLEKEFPIQSGDVNELPNRLRIL